MEKNNILNKEEKGIKTYISNKKIKYPLIIIFTVLIIILLLFLSDIIRNENTISEKKAESILVGYLNAQTGGGVEFVSSADKGNLYEITVSYRGRNIPLHITKDGEYFIQSMVPMTKNTAELNSNVPAQKPSQESSITKSNKPQVEAFIFSYCPYGLQFERALFPVYDLLKDKVDFNIVAIGAMHGEFEKIESLRQISIEQLYDKEKLFAYLTEFNNNVNIGSCNGDPICLEKYILEIYSKLKINKEKIDNYIKTDAEKIYNIQGTKAKTLGIGGSPTFVINGVNVQVERNPNAIKEIICSAFNNPPSECSVALSPASVSAGFGNGMENAPNAAQC